jgi:ABC-type transporter Mla subunit MlaD
MSDSSKPEGDLASEMRAWAEAHPGEQADFLQEAAEAITKPAGRAQWSFVNIPDELERRAKPRRTGEVLRVLAGLTYLVPVFLTWLHLRHAVAMYADVGRALGPGESLDFLAYWSGAEGSFVGTTLQMTAFQVLLTIFAIPIAQLLVGFRQPEDDAPLSPELRALALRAQLLFYESRAVTPRELTDAMSAAAEQLGAALESASAQLKSFNFLAEKITASTERLESATRNLDESATKISSSVEPLAGLPAQLRVIVDATSSAASNLQATKEALATTTNSVSQIVSTTQSASQDATRIAEATKHLVTEVSKTLERAEVVAERVKTAAEESARLGTVVSDHEPHVAILNQATLKLQESVNQLLDIAKLFVYSADVYRKVNEEHRTTETD